MSEPDLMSLNLIDSSDREDDARLPARPEQSGVALHRRSGFFVEETPNSDDSEQIKDEVFPQEHNQRARRHLARSLSWPPGLFSDGNTPPTSDTDLGPPVDLNSLEEDGGVTIRPELDQIDASNAQSRYPPEACAFVANLPTMAQDELIISKLKEIFGPDGPIFYAMPKKGESWVILRRNPNNGNPFAFVQYKTQEEAQVAIDRGRNYTVCGRRCRTEVPRALRNITSTIERAVQYTDSKQGALYISCKDGHQPAEAEIRDLLRKYQVDRVQRPSQSEKQLYGLGDGYWVYFDLYGEAQEALRLLKGHEVFHVQYRRWDNSDVDTHHTQVHKPGRHSGHARQWTSQSGGVRQDTWHPRHSSSNRHHHGFNQPHAGSGFGQNHQVPPYYNNIAHAMSTNAYIAPTQGVMPFYGMSTYNQLAHPWGCRCAGCYANAEWLTNQDSYQ